MNQGASVILRPDLVCSCRKSGATSAIRKTYRGTVAGAECTVSCKIRHSETGLRAWREWSEKNGDLDSILARLSRNRRMVRGVWVLVGLASPALAIAPAKDRALASAVVCGCLMSDPSRSIWTIFLSRTLSQSYGQECLQQNECSYTTPRREGGMPCGNFRSQD